MTLPLSYSRIPYSIADCCLLTETYAEISQQSANCSPPSGNRQSPIAYGGQGRIRTSVDHKGRQIYSLLLLTAQPPVQVKFRERDFPAEVWLLFSSARFLGLEPDKQA